MRKMMTLAAFMVAISSAHADVPAPSPAMVKAAAGQAGMVDLNLIMKRVKGGPDIKPGVQAVAEFNVMLMQQYGVSAEFLTAAKKGDVHAQMALSMHESISVLAMSDHVIAARAIAREVSKLPGAGATKLIQLDRTFLDTATSAPSDDLAFTKILDLSAKYAGDLSRGQRKDWATYISWSIHGAAYGDELAMSAGLEGLERAGASKKLVVDTKKAMNDLLFTRTKLARSMVNEKPHE